MIGLPVKITPGQDLTGAMNISLFSFCNLQL